MRHAHRNDPLLISEIRHPDLLQEHHCDVAVSFFRRSLQRISELFHFVADAVLFQSRCHNRKAVIQAL